MTAIQQQIREVKEIAEKLDQNYSKLTKRIENFDREKRQFSIIQQNILNVQNLSKELLDSLERVDLRKKGN